MQAFIRFAVQYFEGKQDMTHATAGCKIKKLASVNEFINALSTRKVCLIVIVKHSYIMSTVFLSVQFTLQSYYEHWWYHRCQHQRTKKRDRADEKA